MTDCKHEDLVYIELQPAVFSRSADLDGCGIPCGDPDEEPRFNIDGPVIERYFHCPACEQDWETTMNDDGTFEPLGWTA